MATTRLLRVLCYSFPLLAGTAFREATVSGSTLWNWSYSAPGITAGGTFTTGDMPSQDGGFLITSITGTRNGTLITGLQPAGTAIPGNEPFAVDNLVFNGPDPKLTVDGFGFATADGNFANPFYADFLPSPGYLEFFSTPPFTDNGQGAGDSETPIHFNATPVPEPTPPFLIVGALAAAAFARAVPKRVSRK